MDRDTALALRLLRDTPDLIADARIGAPLGNSLAGALLARPFGPIGARQYAERAVVEALAILDRAKT